MPRSHKIWVVMQPLREGGDANSPGWLLGAFTVKHELHACAAKCNWYTTPGLVVGELIDGPEKVVSFKSYPLERP